MNLVGHHIELNWILFTTFIKTYKGTEYNTFLQT